MCQADIRLASAGPALIPCPVIEEPPSSFPKAGPVPIPTSSVWGFWKPSGLFYVSLMTLETFYLVLTHWKDGVTHIFTVELYSSCALWMKVTCSACIESCSHFSHTRLSLDSLRIMWSTFEVAVVLVSGLNISPENRFPNPAPWSPSLFSRLFVLSSLPMVWSKGLTEFFGWRLLVTFMKKMFPFLMTCHGTVLKLSWPRACHLFWTFRAHVPGPQCQLPFLL